MLARYYVDIFVVACFNEVIESSLFRLIFRIDLFILSVYVLPRASIEIIARWVSPISPSDLAAKTQLVFLVSDLLFAEIYLIIFWCLQPLRLSRVYHLLAFSHFYLSILSFPLRLAAIFLSGRSRLVSQLLKSRFLLQSHKNTTNRQMEGIEYLKRLWLLILVRHPFCCIVCTALQSLLHCGGVRFPVKNV